MPYDAKQNFAPLAARVIENERADSPKGSWGYFPALTSNSTATSIVAPSAIGDTKVYLASVGGLAVNDSLNVDTAANLESATITAVGTAAGAATTLFSAASIGATNVKVPSVTGFVVGQQILVDTAGALESRTITTVGTAGTATTLSAATLVGATNIRVASVANLAVGDSLTIDNGAILETRTITSVGTQGAGGTGVNVTPALSFAHTNASPVRDQTKSGTGITFSAGLSSAHVIGSTTRGSGTGVTLSAPLTKAHAFGAAAQGARQRYIGVYTPPGYDPNRAQPYKTIYLQHGSGQDASDWLNIGDAPVLMDNLIQDGLTEPAVIITTDQTYLGASPYNILTTTIVPYVESHYNVSTDRLDRAFAGLSAGAATTLNILNNDPLRFGYYAPWDGGTNINLNTPNLNQAYVFLSYGRWDTTATPPSQATINNLAASPNLHMQYLLFAGAHDFNTWDQQLTTWMRDYLWKPAKFSYVPQKNPQLINFGAVSDVTFGDADFGISATATSNLPVSLEVTSGPCSLDSATSPANVQITGSGSCTITASQGGNGSFDAAAPVVRSFQVAKANQTIDFAALADKTYGDADFDVSATASSGLDITYSALGACTMTGASVHLSGAGECTIKASQTGDDNWNPAPDVSQTFQIAKGSQTISFDALAGKTLGDADFGVSATSSSGLEVSFAASGACTVTGATVHLTGVGSCTITASQAGDANWKAAASVSRTFAITYHYDGLLQPINDTGHVESCGPACTLSIFKANSTVPVKFVLKDVDGNVVVADTLPIWGTPIKIGPLSSGVDESVYTDAPTSGGTFALNDSQYHYNWSTKGLQAGYIYKISVILDDGTTQSAFVGLR